MSVLSGVILFVMGFLPPCVVGGEVSSRISQVRRFYACASAKKPEDAFQCRYRQLDSVRVDWLRRRLAADPLGWTVEPELHECGFDKDIQVCGFIRLGKRRAKIRFAFSGTAQSLSGYRYIVQSQRGVKWRTE